VAKQRNITEHWPHWRGRITIILRDKRGRFLPGSGRRLDNLIVNAGQNLLRDGLIGAVTDTAIHYVALGTGMTAPAATDTQLGAESFRKAVTSQVAGSSVGQAVTTIFIAPQDANFTIQEIGWFAGVGATSSANSGVMVARVLYSHNHTNLESIQIQRQDNGI